MSQLRAASQNEKVCPRKLVAGENCPGLAGEGLCICRRSLELWARRQSTPHHSRLCRGAEGLGVLGIRGRLSPRGARDSPKTQDIQERKEAKRPEDQQAAGPHMGWLPALAMH